MITKPSKDIYCDAPLPCAIKQIHIENYQGIIKTHITEIPVDSQWIFLTGENSFGKTSVLQAICIGLFGLRDQKRILTEENCHIGIELKNNGDNHIIHLGLPQFTNLVTYGSSRLQIQNTQAQNDLSEKSSKTYSLFNVDGILLNIEYELLLWFLTKNKRYEIVTTALLKLLPSITHIEIKDKTHVVYIEQDENQQVYKAIPFEKLASGYKSIIAIIGDLLIRFFKEQNVDNPDDLTGIVLIDELDLHLHPKWLRKLPILLSSIFPKIQFIVSTHSVIPFLGAPQHSVFLKVTRTQETGIQLEKLHIDIKNLLPNSILTSPIFDLEGEDIRRDL